MDEGGISPGGVNEPSEFVVAIEIGDVDISRITSVSYQV